MPGPIYSDGRYTVTSGSVATPSRFYPVANTTAMVRRDPLWAGLALVSLSGAALLAYGDLLFSGEKLTILVIAGMSAVAGSEIRVLCIDALGHRPAVLIGRRKRIAALYRAIRRAHDGTSTAQNSFTPEQTLSSDIGS